MLSLTKKTEYALIALAHMASEPGQVNSAREIADRYHMPLPLLMNILKTLTQQGIAKSVRGARGGYLLALDAKQITLDRLIDAIEGPVRLVQCAKPASPRDAVRCDLTRWCPLRSSVQKVHRRLEKLLSQVSLAEIAEDYVPLESSSTVGLANEASHLPR